MHVAITNSLELVAQHQQTVSAIHDHVP